MTNDEANEENWPQPEGLWLKIPHSALLFARLTRYQSVWNIMRKKNILVLEILLWLFIGLLIVIASQNS